MERMRDNIKQGNNEYFSTALYCACCRGNIEGMPEVIDLIIETFGKDCNPKQVNANGDSAIYCLRMHNLKDQVFLLSKLLRTTFVNTTDENMELSFFDFCPSDTNMLF